MNKTIITPAFRSRYVEILHNNLQKVRDEFDNWVIWVNTNNPEDVNYFKYLENNFDYINLQYISIPNTMSNIYKFWEQTIDENTVYIRIDEDIVYIHPGSITKLYNYRLENPHPFVVFGNIINNSITDYILQERNIINYNPKITYNCLCEVGWKNVGFAEYIHNLFWEFYESNTLDKFHYPNWVLSNYERFSIGVFACFGKDIKDFMGKMNIEEEVYISQIRPKIIKRPNIILGDALFVHFAFYPQRPHLESNTNLLQKYKELSIKLIK